MGAAVAMLMLPPQAHSTKASVRVGILGGIALFLFQHQLTLMPDHPLHRMGEARQQPRQRDLEPHARLVHIDGAEGPLTQRLDPEVQAVAGPGLLLQREQPRELSPGTAEPVLDAAHRLVLAEPVGNGDDERFRHRGVVSW